MTNLLGHCIQELANEPKIKDLLLAELDRDAVGTRKVLKRVPEGKNDWKPYAQPMLFRYLVALVADRPGGSTESHYGQNPLQCAGRFEVQAAGLKNNEGRAGTIRPQLEGPRSPPRNNR